MSHSCQLTFKTMLLSGENLEQAPNLLWLATRDDLDEAMLIKSSSLLSLMLTTAGNAAAAWSWPAVVSIDAAAGGLDQLQQTVHSTDFLGSALLLGPNGGQKA